MASVYFDLHPKDTKRQIPNYFEFKGRKLNENDRIQFYSYLEFRDKTKNCLQFTGRFLCECTITMLLGFVVLTFDRNQLVHICSKNMNFITSVNAFTSFVLYFKCILFILLRLLNKSEHLFHKMLVTLAIILVEFISSVLNMGVAFLEIIMHNCYFDLIESQAIYLNGKLTKQVIQRTNLHYSFLLHVFLSVLIMYNLINLIKHTFLFMEFLKLEHKAFIIIKRLNQSK